MSYASNVTKTISPNLSSKIVVKNQMLC